MKTQKIKDETGLSYEELDEWGKQDLLSKHLYVSENQDETIKMLEQEIQILDNQLDLKQDQLTLNISHAQRQQSRVDQKQDQQQKEIHKVQRDIQTLIVDGLEVIDNSYNTLHRECVSIVEDFLFISEVNGEQVYQKQQVIERYEDKIMPEKVMKVQEQIQVLIELLTNTANVAISELRNDMDKKTNVEGVLQKSLEFEKKENKSELQSSITEKEKLLQELEVVEQELISVKKDQTYALVQFMRWKQTYDAKKSSKKDHSKSQLQRSDVDSLQDSSKDLIQQYLSTQQSSISHEIEIIRQEVQAKATLQLDNYREQSLLLSLKQVHQQLKDIQNIVNFIQLLIELDQNATQQMFDRLSTLCDELDQLHTEQTIDIQEIRDLEKGDKKQGRTTVDERDALITGINKLMNNVMNLDQQQLFVQKGEVYRKIVNMKRREQSYSPGKGKCRETPSKKLKKHRKEEKNILSKLFKTTYNKQTGELVSENPSTVEKIKLLNYYISKLLDSRQSLSNLLESDSKSHKVTRNGYEISQQEVIVDFICNQSKQLKQMAQ